MSKVIDLTGQRFGRLVVLERGEPKPYTQQAAWKCECDCGKIVTVVSSELRSGHTQSCGCYARDICIQRSYKHGSSRRCESKRLYRIWCSIKYRTHNPNCHEFDRYGGRGITMCEEWENDYTVFEKWAMNNGYQDDLSIDRIDVNKGYYPENCRWADNFTQANNKRTNRFVTINGETHTLKEWCNIKNLSEKMVRDRIRRGWDESQWFIPPVRNYKKKKREEEIVNGEK